MPPRAPVASMSKVFAPSLAAAAAAVHPAGPPPTTITSQLPMTGIPIFEMVCLFVMLPASIG